MRGLDQRTSSTHRGKQRMTDVLFLVESGEAPARKAVAFTLPVFTARGAVTASISYPVIQPSRAPQINRIQVDSVNLRPEPVVDFSVMARRALRDEMPGMMLRGAARAIAKGVAQNRAQKELGPLGGFLTAVASVVTEQADDRMWRMLPGRIDVVRGYLPPGEHRLRVENREVGSIKISGQYAVVPLRVYANRVVVGEVATFGALAAEPPAQAAPAMIPKSSVPAKPDHPRAR